MEFQTLLRRRRMVRSFEDRPLADDVVERIVDCAHRAPSAGFTQGTEVLVLRGPEETGRYWSASFASPSARQTFHWPGLFRAPLLVVAFANEAAYRDRYAEPDKVAPDSRSGTLPWPVPYWYVDAGFAALQIVLGATDEGLGALFFAVARPHEVRAAFGVPAGFEPVGAVAIGHPAPDRPSRSLSRRRRPAAEIVHRGQW